MLELTDTNNTAYLFLSAANRWLEVRTVRRRGFVLAEPASAPLRLSAVCAGLPGRRDRPGGSSGLQLEFTLWSLLKEPGGPRAHVRAHGDLCFFFPNQPNCVMAQT